MKLYIFRHGQTEANITNFIQGNVDLYGLNDTGRLEAAKLSQELSTAKLPIIYSSPLSRAKETAEIVAAANGAAIKIVEGLHEVDMGKADGMYENDAIEKFGDEIFAPFEVTIKETYDAAIAGQESRRQSVERFIKAIEFIKQDCRYDRAGVACHAMVMQYYYYHLFEVKHSFANCEYFVIEV